jgi:broad specificity polyphosphatase/5'/3'-nucleotidase SurE
MRATRNLASYLILGLLTVVAIAGALLGYHQSTTGVTLSQAVANTEMASSYHEELIEHIQGRTQSASLDFNAPDRLGGTATSGNQVTHLVIIGTKEYEAATVPKGTPTKRLRFYVQESEGAKSVDPAHAYLGYYRQAHEVNRSGSTVTMILKQPGPRVVLTYVISGNYVAEWKATESGGVVDLQISQFGSAASVALPHGAKVVQQG